MATWRQSNQAGIETGEDSDRRAANIHCANRTKLVLKLEGLHARAGWLDGANRTKLVLKHASLGELKAPGLRANRTKLVLKRACRVWRRSWHHSANRTKLVLKRPHRSSKRSSSRARQSNQAGIETTICSPPHPHVVAAPIEPRWY